MRNVPFPPPLTFEVRVFEADPWTPRAPGSDLPIRLVTSLQVPFQRSVDERRDAAKKAVKDFYNGQREPSVIVADDHIKATVTKPRPRR